MTASPNYWWSSGEPICTRIYKYFAKTPTLLCILPCVLDCLSLLPLCWITCFLIYFLWVFVLTYVDYISGFELCLGFCITALSCLHCTIFLISCTGLFILCLRIFCLTLCLYIPGDNKLHPVLAIPLCPNYRQQFSQWKESDIILI